MREVLTPSPKQERIKDLNEKLSAAKKVETTLGTEGWKDIIEPTIDRMIRDIIGGKIGDQYDPGGIMSFKDKPVEFYLGYRLALVDLYNRIMNYKKSVKQLEEAVMKQADEKEGLILPMEDSPYYPE